MALPLPPGDHAHFQEKERVPLLVSKLRGVFFQGRGGFCTVCGEPLLPPPRRVTLFRLHDFGNGDFPDRRSSLLPPRSIFLPSL